MVLHSFVVAVSPIEGLRVGSSQVTVAIHEGETFRMDWRAADSDRLRSSEIVRDHAHVGDGRLPFWVRSQAPASFFAVAMDEAFVKQIWETEFGQAGDFELKTAIGVRDLVIDRIGLLGRKELSEGGIGGRLYAESLGTALAVHLLRQYGTSPRAPVIHKGGLASRPLQRVIDYINEHLQDELSLVELARTANLSPHHFATVFKASTEYRHTNTSSRGAWNAPAISCAGTRRPYPRSPMPSGSRAKAT